MMTNAASIEMPKYRCHKEVWALKIAEVRVKASDGTYWLEFVDTNYAPREITGDFVHKHGPKAGGYFVVYKDGYQSFSPADAFEDGYTRI